MPGKSKFKTSVELDGPFFRNDPGRTFAENGRVMLERLAAIGQTDVRGQMQAGQAGRAPMRGVEPSRVSRHVKGRVRSLKGKQWKATAVVSVNNTGFTRKQGMTLMAAASRVESKTHAFKRTTTRLRKSRKINARELLKGISH